MKSVGSVSAVQYACEHTVIINTSLNVCALQSARHRALVTSSIGLFALREAVI